MENKLMLMGAEPDLRSLPIVIVFAPGYWK